jgi:hypothetical protein
MLCDQQLLFTLQKPYFSNNCTRSFDYVVDNLIHLLHNQLSTKERFEKETTMDTHVQTIPQSFRDDMIAHQQLLYVQSHRAKSAFIRNDSMINLVFQSTQFVLYNNFPLHQGEFEFGNDATIDRVSQHAQQLLYDGAPSN